MYIITENNRMVRARMRDGKGIFTRTHRELLYSQLVVMNTVERTLDTIIGTFPTFEIAEKARASFRKAHMEGNLPWDVNEFKRNLDR